MAIRLAANQDYRRTAGLPAVTAFTIMAWSLGPHTIATFEAGGWPEFYFNFVDADGSYYFGAYNGGAFPSNPFTTGLPDPANWWHWYVKRSASTLEAGFRRIGDAAHVSKTVTIGTTATLNSMRVNTDPFGAYGDARYAGLKVWDAALSAAEILAESMALRPQRLANLHSFAPAFDAAAANCAIDFGGAGKNWTVNGSPVVEDGPPIPWGA